MSRKHTFFVHMNATKEWLSLTRRERNLFLEKDFQPLLDKYSSIQVRLYDAEAFSTSCSDIAVFETEVIQDYYFLIDAMRDSKIFTVPYFIFVDIIPAIENGFIEYDRHLAEAS